MINNTTLFCEPLAKVAFKVGSINISCNLAIMVQFTSQLRTLSKGKVKVECKMKLLT